MLEAAANLIEADGYPSTTIERIAAASGVAKTTIYRWWPSRAHLALEVVTERWYEVGDVPDTGMTRTDLIEFLSVNYRNQMGIGGRVIRQLASELTSADELLGEVWDRFIQHRRTIGETIMTRAVERGDLPADADTALLLDIAAGIPMAQQWRTTTIRDTADIETIVDLILDGRIPRLRPEASGRLGDET